MNTPPTPTGTEAEVCADIANRQAYGFAKYKVTVADNPLTPKQWLQHLYEELLDGAVYAKRLMPVVALVEQGHDAELARLREHSLMLSQIAAEVAHVCGTQTTTLEAVRMILGQILTSDEVIVERAAQAIRDMDRVTAHPLTASEQARAALSVLLPKPPTT